MGEVAFFILVTRKYNFSHPWLTCIQDSGLQKLDTKKKERWHIWTIPTTEAGYLVAFFIK
jgi:hypothetical protein